MSFLSGIFLFGLPLLAVPVAIHLLSRRRQDVVKWGAMQFLMNSNIRRRKIWRLDDLFLMLLRTLAVLGIVLALARPLWHRTGPHGGQGRDVVFIWDVSMSMERKPDGERRSFDRMIDKSKELMAQLGIRDSIRAMVTIGRGKWLAADSTIASADQKRFLLDELQKVGVTQASADWIACLGTALRVAPLRNSKARLIVLLSDQQAYGWRQDDPIVWQNLVRMIEESSIPVVIEMYNVIGAAPAAHNLAVDKLTTTRQLLGIGETVVVDAEVHNYGQTTVEQATLNWLLNDVSIGKSNCGPLLPGQSKQVHLKSAMHKAGLNQLNCRLELRDDLDSDNQRTLILETVDHVPVLLVDDTSESDPLKSDKGYLLAALGHDPSGNISSEGSGVFRVTTITAKELVEQTLSSFRAIIFANVPTLDEAAVAKLMDFVRSGGGLWLALGDRTRVEEFNQNIFRHGGGLSPWPIEDAKGDLVRREDFLSIHPPERDHPATVVLSDTQRLDMDRVKVFQRFPFVPISASVNVPVLLQSGTGEPLAIESFLGRGRIFVQSLPMGVRWSNFPLTQAYVPMVHEWLWYLVQPTTISRNLQAGELLQASLPSNDHVREVRLKQPDGNKLTLAMFRKGDQFLVQSRETQLPGPYEVAMTIEGKDEIVWPYQVARSAEESNLDQWPQELTKRWSGSRNLRLNPKPYLELPSGTIGQRSGEPLWATLLMCVVLAFLGEMWLVHRIAKKRFARDANSSVRRPFAQQVPVQPIGTRGIL